MKLVITGRLRSGKNTIARNLGVPEYSFAKPLKDFVDHFSPKHATKAEKRNMYQRFGQWGRGLIDDAHPVTAERMALTHVARKRGAKITGVGGYLWERFGDTEDFWLDILLHETRIVKDLAVCDCRFQNEYDALMDGGFTHIHLLTTDGTRGFRAGRPYDPDIDEHISEQFAISLDTACWEEWASVDDTIVVWNDELSPAPEIGGMVHFSALSDYLSALTPQPLALQIQQK